MKLIELYLEEIRRQLPPRDRDDILREIQSTLMDMVEDRNPNPDGEPDEDTIKAVLTEFGSPRKVARQYGARDYLVGPRMYPIYLQVLRIVLIIVAAANVLGLVIAIVSNSGFNAGLVGAITQVLSGLFSSLFTAFGVVTLSFAGIERAFSKDLKIKLEQSWSPDDLLQEEDKEHIKVVELALEITGGLTFIILINFFLDRIGVYYLSNGSWISAPVLNENFLRYLPWITAYLIIDIAVALYLLRFGFWNKNAVIAKVLNNAFKIAVTFAIITGPAIITIDGAAWNALGFHFSNSAQALTQTLNTGLDVILGLSILSLVVETIRRVYASFIKGNQAGFTIDSES